MKNKNKKKSEKLVTVNVFDIEWDVDNQEELCDLPVDLIKMELPKSMDLENDLADAISDAYGFAIKNLYYEVVA
jgi:hypothetical protein